MREAKKVKIWHFRLYRPKSGLFFRQKEDQFRSIFSKRSAIRPRDDTADLLGSNAVLPSRKSDQEFSKSDFYQTIFLPKIRQKRTTTCYFWGKSQTCFQNLILTLAKSTFIWKNPIFTEIIKQFKPWCGWLKRWKSDFLDFLGQKMDFSSKKRNNLGAVFQKGLIKRTYLAALRWATHSNHRDKIIFTPQSGDAVHTLVANCEQLNILNLLKHTWEILRELQNAARRTSHWLSICQVVFTKGTQEKDQQWIGLSNCILPGLRPYPAPVNRNIWDLFRLENKKGLCSLCGCKTRCQNVLGNKF